MPELTGRSALILGGDDIGRGIAKRFAREGARVSVTDSPNDGSPEDLDILVINTLGPPSLARLEDQTDAIFDATLRSVAGAARVMRAALPAMQSRGGAIILIGHRYGETVSEGIGAYNTAAFALIGLMRTAAVEWGKFGITTNLLLPFADTAEFQSARERRPKVIDLLVNQTPLGRAGDPVEDIGGAAVFLASADSVFVNGQIIYADGGQHVAGPVLNPIKYAKALSAQRSFATPDSE